MRQSSYPYLWGSGRPWRRRWSWSRRTGRPPSLAARTPASEPWFLWTGGFHCFTVSLHCNSDYLARHHYPPDKLYSGVLVQFLPGIILHNYTTVVTIILLCLVATLGWLQLLYCPWSQLMLLNLVTGHVVYVVTAHVQYLVTDVLYLITGHVMYLSQLIYYTWWQVM